MNFLNVFIIKHIMSIKNPITMTWSRHASERARQRGIDKKEITYDYMNSLPIYMRENGCVKYLDITKLVVYYVRKYTIETLIATNPISMLRYYARSKNINFDRLCRDNAFHNCTRGNKCRFIHL